MEWKRFEELLKEYNYPDRLIKIIWDARPDDNMTEESVRAATAEMVPLVEKYKEKREWFFEIMREYGYPDWLSAELWGELPKTVVDMNREELEESVRETNQEMAPMFKKLMESQANRN